MIEGILLCHMVMDAQDLSLGDELPVLTSQCVMCKGEPDPECQLVPELDLYTLMTQDSSAMTPIEEPEPVNSGEVKKKNDKG